MNTQKGIDEQSCLQGVHPFGPQLPRVGAIEVNDDPAQILDVLTLSEQEGEQSGAEIDVARFVYEPTEFSLGSDALDQLFADSLEDLPDELANLFTKDKKERDLNEHN